jgi:D-cysteine desulfhydrase family pyridoxal phosphate-dependent enzyme
MVTDRIPPAALPTPLHRLERLSAHLGADVWMKRDDLTGFAMGGNKVRKAEFLLADAVAQGADTLITAGAVQSNHARVIAAAARAAGMECDLVLSGAEPQAVTGNLLLDRLSGARTHFVATGAERAAAMEQIAERLRREGRNPYVIPIGGSNAVGARGYFAGFEELAAQFHALPPKPASLVVATSSGGTVAGLLLGQRALRSDIRLLPFRVDDDPGAEEAIVVVANELAGMTGLAATFRAEHVPLHAEFVGEGYGIPSAAGLEALRATWELEGILLDTSYTSKAMAGLFHLARAGAFEGQRVIFLHTGGGPSVFANADAVLSAIGQG